jgi:hypothetical protein
LPNSKSGCASLRTPVGRLVKPLRREEPQTILAPPRFALQLVVGQALAESATVARWLSSFSAGQLFHALLVGRKNFFAGAGGRGCKFLGKFRSAPHPRKKRLPTTCRDRFDSLASTFTIGLSWLNNPDGGALRARALLP